MSLIPGVLLVGLKISPLRKGSLEFKRNTEHRVQLLFHELHLYSHLCGIWQDETMKPRLDTHPTLLYKEWKLPLCPCGADQTQDTLRRCGLSHCCQNFIRQTNSSTPVSLERHALPTIKFTWDPGMMYLKWKSYILVAPDQMKKWLPIHLPIYGIQHTASDSAAAGGRTTTNGEILCIPGFLCLQLVLPCSLFKSRILYGCAKMHMNIFI